MKKSVIKFVASVVISAVTVTYGWIFVDAQIGEARLTEETVAGNREMANGLTVGFRADSSDNLHWFNSFDYSKNETKSSFKMGKLQENIDTPVYDNIRFTGWDCEPFYTQLKYERLAGLQQNGIQAFYNEIQQSVMKTGSEETGRIRLRDYLDYYPVSFRVQFGNKLYSSSNALTGLKVYDERGKLSAGSGSAYDEDVDLYAALNNAFKIPVIENEYQEYKVSEVEEYDYKTALGYKTEVTKPTGEDEDFYEFDPIMIIQEENTMDGKKWVHPDLSGGLSYEVVGEDRENDKKGQSYSGKKASEYNLKNRLLITVNNRTAKGAEVDVTELVGGYGIYELPMDVMASTTIHKGRRSYLIPSPTPLTDQLKMVYPLDAEAEYVEMSLSPDHRYLAVFSVKDDIYLADVIDADTWESQGPVPIFPASEKMTYNWGSDGTLALTNHEDYIAVLTRTQNEERPYEILYSGKAADDFDKAFFDTEMTSKKHSYAKYKYCVDSGLAVTTKDGKTALAQSLLIGDSNFGIRNAALECAVIDKTGIVYRGKLKNNIVDLDYDMSADELKKAGHLIEPALNENRVYWSIQ